MGELSVKQAAYLMPKGGEWAPMLGTEHLSASGTVTLLT